ncbi:MAG: Ig-like domain-containing protein [Lachnospiraceae bacterium]|nr:Ig-like domain-containing protein [Lachnospiraceae bacterium]
MQRKNTISKNSIVIALLLVCILVFTGIPVSAASKAKLNKSSATIYVGKSITLKVLNNKQKVKWTTSKKAVATVSKKGVVTGKKAGKATITAKVGTKAYKCKLTVKNPSLNMKKLSIEEGKTAKLALKGAVGTVSWKSSKPEVASVNKKGIVSGVKSGSATITATNKKKSYKCKVTVTKPASMQPGNPQDNIDYTGVSISKTNLTLAENDSYKLTLNGAQANRVIWTSSNPQVAAIDNNAQVRTNMAGTSVITATYGTRKYRCNVSVVGFEFSVYGVQLRPGVTHKITVRAKGVNLPYTLSSTNTSVATVDQQGNVYGVPGKGGSCEIRASFSTDNGVKYNSTEVNVEPFSTLYSVMENEDNNYNQATLGTDRSFTDGQSCDLTLLSSGINKCSSQYYEHAADIDTVYKDGYNYYFVSDTWSNRVLIFRVPEDKVWNGSDVTEYLYCVLGQPDVTSSKAGCSLSALNWPVGVAATKQADGKIKIFVADAKNNRILVWNDIPVQNAHGTPADFSIMQKYDPEKYNYTDTSVMKNPSYARVAWPWDLYTDGERLIATSTQDGYVLIWDKGLPAADDKYPDKVIYTGGTPRTITCNGNYLLVGDHNVSFKGEPQYAALRVFNDIATLDYQGQYNKENNTEKLFDYCEYPGDFAYTDHNSGQPSGLILKNDIQTTNAGTLKAGTLILHEGGALTVWKDGKVDSESDKPNYYIGGNLFNSTDYYYFIGGDIAPLIQDHNNNLYSAGINAGKIVGYKAGTFPAEPASVDIDKIERNGDTFVYNGTYYWNNPNTGILEKHATDAPNICIGARDVKECVADTLFKYQNCVTESNGKYFASLDDYNGALCLWKHLPDSNDAKPDLVYKYSDSVEDVTFVEHDGITGLAVAQRNRLYYYEDINDAFHKELPKTYLCDTIGNLNINYINAIDYCDGYFYMTQDDSLYVYEGVPGTDSNPVATLKMTFTLSDNQTETYRNAKIHVTKCEDGNTYVGIANVGEHACIVKTSDIFEGTAMENANVIEGAHKQIIDKYNDGEALYSTRYRSFGGLSEILVTPTGQVIACDGGFCRIIIWNSIADAVNEVKENSKKSIAILGNGSNYYNVYDVRNADPTNASFDLTDEVTAIQSEDTFFNPFYICYDGTYLWVGDFKFSGGIKRFTGGF